MAEIVNLRQSRKRKRRADKERTAEANRIEHGRPSSEKALTSVARGLEAKRLEGHRRAPANPADGED